MPIALPNLLCELTYWRMASASGVQESATDKSVGQVPELQWLSRGAVSMGTIFTLMPAACHCC